MNFQDPLYAVLAPTFSQQEIIFERIDNGAELKLGLYTDFEHTLAKPTEGNVQGQFDVPQAHTQSTQDGTLPVSWTLIYASAVKFRQWAGGLNTLLNLRVRIPDAAGVYQTHSYYNVKRGGEEKMTTSRSGEPLAVTFSAQACQHIGPTGFSDY